VRLGQFRTQALEWAIQELSRCPLPPR